MGTDACCKYHTALQGLQKTIVRRCLDQNDSVVMLRRLSDLETANIVLPIFSNQGLARCCTHGGADTKILRFTIYAALIRIQQFTCMQGDEAAAAVA